MKMNSTFYQLSIATFMLCNKITHKTSTHNKSYFFSCASSQVGVSQVDLNIHVGEGWLLLTQAGRGLGGQGSETLLCVSLVLWQATPDRFSQQWHECQRAMGSMQGSTRSNWKLEFCHGCLHPESECRLALHPQREGGGCELPTKGR